MSGGTQAPRLSCGSGQHGWLCGWAGLTESQLHGRFPPLQNVRRPLPHFPFLSLLCPTLEARAGWAWPPWRVLPSAFLLCRMDPGARSASPSGPQPPPPLQPQARSRLNATASVEQDESGVPRAPGPQVGRGPDVGDTPAPAVARTPSPRSQERADRTGKGQGLEGSSPPHTWLRRPARFSLWSRALGLPPAQRALLLVRRRHASHLMAHPRAGAGPSAGPLGERSCSRPARLSGKPMWSPLPPGPVPSALWTMVPHSQAGQLRATHLSTLGPP